MGGSMSHDPETGMAYIVYTIAGLLGGATAALVWWLA